MEGYKEKAKDIMVIGHKNPDTDSICSAICYADLKNKITGTNNYVPKRAGHLNEETHFVLNRFGVKAPEYIKDVRPQVMNIEIRQIEGIDREISVRNAWKLMDTLNVVTLPITEGKKLTGLVSIDDIAKSYFETFDNNPFILNCFESIFELAEFKNIIPIVASGSNLNLENSIRGIALCKNCLTVGGLNTTKYEIEPYNFSSSGNKNLKKPELSAACSEIRCLNSNASYVPENNGIKLYPRKLNDNYITFSGTSLACAYISGLCAILLDNTPNLTLKDLRSLITLSCNEIEYYSNDTVGEGYLDLKRFFKSIL